MKIRRAEIVPAGARSRKDENLFPAPQANPAKDLRSKSAQVSERSGAREVETFLSFQ